MKKYAFSGGQDTLEKHRELGANLEGEDGRAASERTHTKFSILCALRVDSIVDVPYAYLRFFLEDDAELEKVGTEVLPLVECCLCLNLSYIPLADRSRIWFRSHAHF